MNFAPEYSRILTDLFLPRLAALGRVTLAAEQGAGLQRATGDLQKGQPLALGVPGHLVHRGGKVLPVGRRLHKAGQGGQQLVQPVQLQGRAEKAGEHPPRGHPGGNGLVRKAARLQKVLHQVLAAQGQLFVAGGLGLAKVGAAGGQPGLQLLHQGGAARAGQVHLVHEQQHRHPVPGQQLPQGQGVALQALAAADHQNGAVQHLKGALGLGGKIHVAGGVQQRHRQAGHFQQRLLGKDGDAPGPLLGVRVQKGVAVVHAAQAAQGPAAVQKPLGKGGFARIHMGKNADDKSFHKLGLRKRLGGRFKTEAPCRTRRRRRVRWRKRPCSGSRSARSNAPGGPCR